MNILTSGEVGLAVYGEGQAESGQFLTPAAHSLLYEKEIPGHEGATLKDFIPVTFLLKVWTILLFRLRPITVEELWAFAWPDKEFDLTKALPNGMEEDTLRLAALRRSLGLPSMHYKDWMRYRNQKLEAAHKILDTTGKATKFLREWRECTYLPLVWVKVIPDDADDRSVDSLIAALKRAVEATNGAPGCIAEGVRDCIARNEAMLIGSFFSMEKGGITAASGAPYSTIRGEDGQPKVVLRDPSHSNLMRFGKDNGMRWLLPRQEMLAIRDAMYERLNEEKKRAQQQQKFDEDARRLASKAYGF